MNRRELFRRVFAVAGGLVASQAVTPGSSAPTVPLTTRTVGAVRVFGPADILSGSLQLEYDASGLSVCRFAIGGLGPTIGTPIAISIPSHGVAFRGSVTEVTFSYGYGDKPQSSVTATNDLRPNVVLELDGRRLAEGVVAPHLTTFTRHI